jgi:hypothetical protein
MNRMAGDKAMSAQDAQRQQQGQPTAAQQAQRKGQALTSAALLVRSLPVSTGAT